MKSLCDKLYCFFFFFSCLHAIGGVDSLKLELKKAKHDTTRCSILCQLAILENDTKTWMDYNDQLKTTAEKNINDKANGKELVKLYQRFMASALANYGVYYEQINEYDKAMVYINQSLELSKAIDFKFGMILSYNDLGVMSFKKGDHDKALVYYNQSLLLQKQEKDKKAMARTLMSMGPVYYEKGDMKKAVESYFSALKISESIGDSVGVEYVCNSIGVFYEKQKEPDLTLAYYLRGLKICEANGNKEEIALFLHNIAASYQKKGDSERSLVYFNRTLQLAESENNKRMAASARNGIGNYYLRKDEIEKSLGYFMASLKVAEELEDQRLITSTCLNILNAYFKAGKYDQAETYGKRALKISGQVGQIINQRDAAEDLTKVYLKKNNYREAYKMHELYIQMRDSINNETTRKVAIRTQLQYEFDKKENRLKFEQEKKEAFSAEQNKIKNLQLSRSRYLAYGLGGIIFLILVVAFLFIRQNKLQSKQKSMQLEQKLLRSQMNPHFLFNSLQAIQSFIFKNEPKEAARYLSSFATLTRSVLENSRMELIPLKKEIKLLEDYFRLQKLRLEERFDYTISVAPDLDIEQTLIPPMLAQPFIENALEHGMADIETGGKIEVNFTMLQNKLSMEIKDNGNGLKINVPSQKEHQSMATSITKERIALMNKSHKEKISFVISEAFPEQVVRKGVKVSFIIPLQY